MDDSDRMVNSCTTRSAGAGAPAVDPGTASPIGRALLNREEGDEVVVTTPNGSRKFEVIKLVTIHDE